MKARDYSVIQAKIWEILDTAKCAVTKESICEKIICSENEFDEAKKALIHAGELYFCQNGFILKEYASYDEKLWHLAWSLGLMENSSINVLLDKDLLLLASDAIIRLIKNGEMDEKQKHRLIELKNKAVASQEAPKLLLDIYNKVAEIINKELESSNKPVKILKDFKDLKKLKNKI